MMPSKFPLPRQKTSLLTGTLFASAALNLFLVGVLAGAVPGGSRHKSFAPMSLTKPHSEYLVGEMVRYLDTSDATAFRDAVRAQTPALKKAHDHVRQATKDIAAIFEEDPPDQAALQTALDHLSEARVDVDTTVKKILQDAYIRLSPEGRRRLSEMTR